MILRYLRRALGWIRFFVRGPESLPVLPAGQSWVLYRSVSSPNLGMLVIKQGDTLFIPSGPHEGEPWVPTNEWAFEKEHRAGGKA